MGQLVSVRSNQDFGLDYKSGKLIPQTEVIVLVQCPEYKSKGDKIARSYGIKEVRFKCGSEGIAHLIGQLEHAQRIALQFEKMAGQFNEIIVNTESKSEPEA